MYVWAVVMIEQFGTEINAILKFIAGIGVAVVAWFCKGILVAQKETDERVHATQRELDKHKLDVAQNYHTKTDAAVARNEHRDELKRVHERLDTLPKEIADLMRAR